MNTLYNVKPIPTSFRGIKYRSRLEARWAVFFEQLELDAWYEYEGFQLPIKYNGWPERWYVPDFYLPALDKYFEVKPGDEYVDSDALWGLATVTEKTVVSLVGIENPYNRGVDRYEVFFSKGYWNGQVCYPMDVPHHFCRCMVCGKYGLIFGGEWERICQHEGLTFRWGEHYEYDESFKLYQHGKDIDWWHPQTQIEWAYSLAQRYQFY